VVSCAREHRYHIAFDATSTACPITLVQELMEVRATPTTVRSFTRDNVWLRSPRSWTRPGMHEKAHRPKSHQAIWSRSPSRAWLHWAEQIGPEHRAALCEDLGREAASEMGYRSLSGHHPTRRKVFSGQDGSGRRSRTTDGAVPLPEREIDSEKLARPTTTHCIAFTSSSASARQHSWR